MESRFCEYTTQGKTRRFASISPKISADDAYLIGYLACDGGFVAGHKGYSFMQVSSTDRSVIEWIRDCYVPDSTIYAVGVKSSSRVNATNAVYELRFSPRASKQFDRFGIFCPKPKRRLVAVPKHHTHAYVAGVLDADGFVSVTHRRDCRTPRLRFFVTHGGEKFLSDVQEFLPIRTTLRQHGLNAWRLQAQNTTDNCEFLQHVYPYMRNGKKRRIVESYLNQFYVPQASGELLEGES